MLEVAKIVATLALASHFALLALVLRKASSSALRRAFVAFLLTTIVWSFAALMIRVDPKRAGQWFGLSALATSAGLPLTVFYFVKNFTQGHRSRLWFPIGLIGLLVVTYIMLGKDTIRVTDLQPDGMFKVNFHVSLLDAVVALAYWLFFLNAAIYELIIAYRRTNDPIRRNRLRYPLIAIVLIMLGLVGNVFGGLRQMPLDIAANWLSAVLLAYAILRYRLLDVVFVLRIGLSFASVVLLIALGYIGSLYIIDLAAGPNRSIVLLLLSALGAWLLLRYVPGLQQSLQLRIDRILFPQRYDEQALLTDLGKAGQQLRPTPDVATLVLERLHTSLRVRYGSFFVPSPNDGHFYPAATVGDPPGVSDVYLRADHPLVQYLEQGKEGLDADHLPDLPQLKAMWAIERQQLQDLQPDYFLPVLWEGKMSGLFILGPKGNHETYSLADQRLLGTLANQLAVVLENGHLYGEALQRRRLAEALARVGVAASSSLELFTVLDLICRESATAFGAQGAYIWVREGEQLVGKAGHGSAKPDFAGTSCLMDDPDRVPARAAREEEIVTLDEADPEFRRDASLWPRFHARSLVAIPLAVSEGIVGVLMLVDEEHANRFSRLGNMEELHLLGSQTALAIQNASLYQATQAHLIELEKAYEELKELDRLKDEFVQTVSHELRTPLTFIKGYLELLLGGIVGPELAPEQAEALQIIAMRTDGVIRLVNDILSIQMATSGHMHREPVPVAEVARMAVEGAQAEAAHRQVSLSLHTAPGLHFILGDEGRLGQVFDNLIGNAIKFCDPGKAIDVRIGSDAAWVTVEVVNEGIGIPAEHLDKIWERFYQVDGSTTRKHGGTGLGLAIVKRIVEGHGGTVAVASEVGRGSTFTIRLPVMKDEDLTAELEPAAAVTSIATR